MKKNLLLMFILAAACGCRKEFDQPPVREVTPGSTLGISQIKARVSGTSTRYAFSGDTVLYGVLTADERSGNFYRRCYLQDEEGASIELDMLSTGGLYTGDRVRVSLSGTMVKKESGMILLDSVDLEKHIIKLSSGNPVQTQPLSMAQLLSDDHQSKLVELNDVEFIYAHRGTPLGDQVTRTTRELVLTDCSSRTITVRTSGYASFAGVKAPELHGRVTGIVTRFNNSVSMELRSASDLNMTSAPCTGSATTTSTFVLSAPVSTLSENFSGITDQGDFQGEGWINFSQTGKTKWKGNIKSLIYKSARASAYGAGEKVSVWLISPPVIYSPALHLNFKTGVEYFKPGHLEAVMAYVCTNFNGSNFETANWTPLTNATYAGEGDGTYNGAGGLKPSGDIPLKNLPLLAGYSGNIFIAFRYSGEPGYDSNVYLDDVTVK